MHGPDQIFDSYQNLVCSPTGNDSVESITPDPGRGSVEHATEDSEGDTGSTGDAPSGRHEAVHGRGASGDSYEDEADNGLLHPEREASSTDTYDGGNLGPSGRLIERAKGKG